MKQDGDLKPADCRFFLFQMRHKSFDFTCPSHTMKAEIRRL